MRRLVFAILACAWLASFHLNAQVNASGTLLGTVTDNSGAVVPGAVIKATSKDTGQSRETRTNDSGQYRFDLLPIGTYEVRVSMKGFASQVYGNVGLAVSQATTIDASLSPSTQVEVITVEEAGMPLIDTTKTDVSVPISTKEIQDLQTS